MVWDLTQGHIHICFLRMHECFKSKSECSCFRMAPPVSAAATLPPLQPSETRAWCQSLGTERGEEEVETNAGWGELH